MTETSHRFVLLPNYLNIKKLGLQYRDLLTYITIRSFLNSSTDLCKPSYETIVKMSGTSKRFISESIKRLKLSGLLKVTNSGKPRGSNYYSFEKCESFSRIPYDVFEA